MRKKHTPDKSPTGPDLRNGAKAKKHGILTAAHNDKRQEGAPKGGQTCVADQNKKHGLLTAAHNNEKRP
ncbi:MAG: hypothetical protein ABIR70_21505 [Bryobacteraceae bacterium]